MKKVLKPLSITSAIVVLMLLFISLLSNLFNDVTAFSLDDFRDEMEFHSSDILLGEVSSAKDAKSMALKVLKDEYGLDIYLRFPYRVYFDEQSKTWLVRGSFFFEESGPCIMISQQDGRVLAVWDYQF